MYCIVCLLYVLNDLLQIYLMVVTYNHKLIKIYLVQIYLKEGTYKYKLIKICVKMRVGIY